MELPPHGPLGAKDVSQATANNLGIAAIQEFHHTAGSQERGEMAGRMELLEGFVWSTHVLSLRRCEVLVTYILAVLFAAKILWNIGLPYWAYRASLRCTEDRAISFNPQVELLLLIGLTIAGGISGASIGPIRGWLSLLLLGVAAVVLSYVHAAAATSLLRRWKCQKENNRK